MRIKLNGNELDTDFKTIKELVESRGLDPEKIVVDRNGTIVHRENYSAEYIAEGDVIEILRFVGGG